MGLKFEHVVQVVILILALRALHMVSASRSCAEVRRHFEFRKIGPMRTVPHNPVTAKNLRVCPNEVTSCCNDKMEHLYEIEAKTNIENALQMVMSSLKINFGSFTLKFQEDVVETLKIAENSTRDVLRKLLRKRKITPHKRETAIHEIQHLFQSLGLKATERDIERAFDRFTDRLLLLLVDQQFNSSHRDLAFEECVAQTRKDLNIFMDEPIVSAANISTGIRFARILHEALSAGSKAVNATETVHLTKHCQEALLKMQFCSHCWGLTLIKPCMGLCKNVIRGCFAGLTELDLYWKHYVTALLYVADRMRSTEPQHNLEIALEDIENKLSSSIAAILDNITSLTEHVEKRCENSRSRDRSKRSEDSDLPLTGFVEEENKLRLTQRHAGRRRNRNKNRRRGSVPPGFNKAWRNLEEDDAFVVKPSVDSHQPIRPPHEVLFNSPSKGSDSRKVPYVVSKKPTSKLHVRIQRFISLLNDTIDFYSLLPDDMCGHSSKFGIQVSDDTTCWDGLNIVESYQKDVIPAGYRNQGSNPEIEVLKVENEIVHAIESLRLAAAELLRICDKTVPRLLQQAPAFEERTNTKIQKTKTAVLSCDDEDDCQPNGSGDDKEGEREKKDHSKRKDVIKIEIDFLPRNESRATKVDNDSSVIIEEKIECKRKGKRCRNKGSKEAKNTVKSTKQPSTTTPENSAVIASSINSFLYVALIAAWMLALSSHMPA